jgi:hypothetical protein
MPASRIVGIVLLVVGLIVLGLAYQSSQSTGDQAKQFFTGNLRDKTVWMIIAGAGSSIAGLIALLVPVRKVGGGFAT